MRTSPGVPKLPHVLLILAVVSLGVQSTAPAGAVGGGGKPSREAGGPATGEGGPRVVQATAFGVSRPVRKLAALPNLPSPRVSAAASDREIPMHALPTGDPSAKAGDRDAALQRSDDLTPNIPAPSLSFEGLSNADNQAAFGFMVLPPSMNGDVGPNHYVQQTHLLVRIFGRSGAPLTSPFKLSSLFTGIGPPCEGRDDGWPVVLYDPMADRWLLSQFCFTGGATHQLIAISRTPNPTGSYFVYDFPSPNGQFDDYPKLGVWPDAYYMTSNQFNTAGTAFLGAGAYAFDRIRMLAGDPTASLVFFDLDPDFGGMLPSDFDGLVAPPVGAPNTFAMLAANEFGDPGDALRLFDFHADFATPENSTFTERPESPVAVAAYDPRAPGGRQHIEQPPPATAASFLNSLSDRLMYRLQYRNRNGTQTLVVNHTVNVSGVTPSTPANHRAGIRYYELRRTGGGGYTVGEQATFSPDAENRWMGSAATDHMGNLAVGYSVSSATTFPSIRYAGRLATDPPGGLAQGETTLIGGSGSQTSTISRWGDYSAMAVDPVDDCTFWFTSEYYATSSSVGWQTRVGRFKFAECTPAPRGTLQGTVTNAANGSRLTGATLRVSNGFVTATSPSGLYTFHMKPGTYSVTVSRAGFATKTVTGVSVTTGGTTNLGIALTPLPVINAAGSAIIAERFTPANGAIDPGEPVTVDFRLANVGLADTSNLVATLQSSGAVLNPSAPKTYGVIPKAGGIRTRRFAFQAGEFLACGGTLQARLQLQDGARNLGVAVFTFTLGSQHVHVSENFDGVTAPALPAGWAAANATDPDGVFWATSGTSPDSAPNTAFVNDPSMVSDKRLESPALVVESAGAALVFRNDHQMETGYDGGVLEMSVDGGPYEDVLAAGGTFATGGYTHTISTGYGSPIGGRQGWSGNSGGYQTTRLNLPASVAGHMVQFRWRMASDSSVASVGWRVDSITVEGHACTPPQTDLRVTKTHTPGPVAPGNTIQYTINARNPIVKARNVVVRDTIPAGTTFESASAPAGWTITSPQVGSTGTVLFKKTPMARTESAALVLVVRAGPSQADGSVITNTATIASTTPELAPADNSSTDQLTLASPRLTIGNVAMNEGDSGPTTFAFRVTRSGDTRGASSVRFATSDGSATAASGDYASRSGTLNFGAGSTLRIVNVTVNGDVTFEPNETFLVGLSIPVGAIIADSQGQGTIQNDD